MKKIFFNFILFFNFTILYWFCHISTWKTLTVFDNCEIKIKQCIYINNNSWKRGETERHRILNVYVSMFLEVFMIGDCTLWTLEECSPTRVWLEGELSEHDQEMNVLGIGYNHSFHHIYSLRQSCQSVSLSLGFQT